MSKAFSGLTPTVIFLGAVLAACSPESNMTGNDKKPSTVLDLDAAVARAKSPELADKPTGVSLRLRSGTFPPDAPEPLRRWYESVMQGRPAFAVVEEPLPGGEVARVIRDPKSSGSPRLIVVSRATVDDEVLALANFLLLRSEMNKPELGERRTITLWRDRRFTVEQAGRVESGVFDYTYLGAAGERSSAEALLRRMDSASQTLLLEVGAATFIPAGEPLRK